MSQKMNRQYRREMKRDEQRRQKRTGEWRARRREKRLAKSRPAAKTMAKTAPKLNFGQWVRTPYKPADLFLLFLILWGLRYAAMSWLGNRPGADADPVALTGAGLVTQIGFGLVLVAYIRALAREPMEWLGPADERTPAIQAAGAGVVIGVIAWGFTYVLTQLWAVLGRVMPIPVPPVPTAGALVVPGVLPDSTALAGAAGGLWAAVALLLVVNAFTDELFYRRVLMRLLERIGLSDKAVIFFSTFLFAVSMGTTNLMLGNVLAGAAFAMFYARTKATLIPVIGHLTWGVLRFLMG